VAYLDTWSKKVEEEQENKSSHQNQHLHQIFLQASTFMYVSFTIFGMHCICMWFVGCLLVVTCDWHGGWSGLTMDFLSFPFLG